jgi:aspartyl-tRNA(Asn)/glutamyl-tRNA(Gln) amidotransferase subunit A
LRTVNGSPLASIASALSQGTASSASLVDEALAAASDPAGEGGRAFIRLRAQEARREARASDEARRAGRSRGPLEGIPLSVKDLFDVAGEVTTAGSRVLADRRPAAGNADAVDRLVAAGAILVGRTNMTEFAFSGLGLNPHYGTPASPWRRDERRIPGGSSSGAAVSVSDGMCAAAIGTDTGGSLRIPAACCGLVGWKPTARRVPTRGAVPLSVTLDSIGPLARSVACCAVLDAVLAGEPLRPIEARPPRDVTLGIAREPFLAGADVTVAAVFERAVSWLAAAGFNIVELDLPVLRRIPEINASGGLLALESWAWHRDLLAAREAEYDPRVAVRIKRGAALTADDGVRLARERQAVIDEIAPALRGVDAVAAATIPFVPPSIASLVDDDAAYAATNVRILANTNLVNFIDGCALSVPCHDLGDAPVGFMLFSGAMADHALLDVGSAVEGALREARAGQPPY